MRRRVIAVAGWIGGCLAGVGGLVPTIATAGEEGGAAPTRAALEQQLSAAQQRLNEAAREVAALNRSLSGGSGNPIVSGTFGNPPERRAVLGINIGPFGDTDSEDGVEVVSVSPGGPAAVAGLQSGDVLLEVKGRKLQRAAERSPRAILLEVMDGIGIGENVPVSYRRAGKVRKADVRTRAIEPEMFTMPLPPPHGMGAPGFRVGPQVLRRFGKLEGLFGRAELVALTPKLSQYFGTDKGLLVVRAPEDAGLKLEDGDVLLSIDGREPKSPAHAARILGSYQPGEKLKLDVIRLKRRMTLDITAPERASFEPSSFMPAHPAEDVLFVTPFERT